jgi:hypothetical protein
MFDIVFIGNYRPSSWLLTFISIDRSLVPAMFRLMSTCRFASSPS